MAEMAVLQYTGGHVLACERPVLYTARANFTPANRARFRLL